MRRASDFDRQSALIRRARAHCQHRTVTILAALPCCFESVADAGVVIRDDRVAKVRSNFRALYFHNLASKIGADCRAGGVVF